jgi:ABC-type microcin C transport system permease subunit YejE
LFDRFYIGTFLGFLILEGLYEFHQFRDNKIKKELMKTFRTVTLISMILTLTVATACVIGVAITGFYPGIIVLLLLTLIPIASNFYAKKIISKSNVFQKNYYKTLTMLNLLTILVVLWMTFVILVDRVFGKIL